MSDFSHSTLTSPRSPLFSDSDTPERQSGSEIVTSDEEPDLGAFTAVLRAWGYLQPPLRIPAHILSSSSSRSRPTPTTITGYPGFGGDGNETVEESTVWNRIPIQSYFRTSLGTETSSGRTELAREPVLEELDDEEFASSPPPSPASDGARTVEIAYEVDAPGSRSVTYEDGTSGERIVVRVATPSQSIDGRTVSVASGAESQDEQTPFTRLSERQTLSLSIAPHLPVVNDNTFSSLSSGSPIPPTTQSSYSGSNQPLDDNTTISRRSASPSTISVVSYQPQMTAPRTQPSVFQESPSPNPALAETGTTSFSLTDSHNALRPPAHRVVSSSSHAESDIINSYYAQGPSAPSPSTDQPVLDFPRLRRLEILAQPHRAPGSNQQPLLEQDSPLPDQRRPSIVDDNSSTSALTEHTPLHSAMASRSASVLQENLTGNSESPVHLSSHSLTPHTIILPSITASTSTSTTTTQATATANHTRHSSLDSISFTQQYPSFASTYRENQRPRVRPRLDTSTFREMQTAQSHLHYHSLSSEGDPDHEQPSLGYLDEALSFIAAERVRWNAAREAGIHRDPSPQSLEDERVSEAGGTFQQGGTWRHAIESQPTEYRRRRHHYKGYKSLTTASSHTGGLNGSIAEGEGVEETSTSERLRNAIENVVILDSPQSSPRKQKYQTNSTFSAPTYPNNNNHNNEITPISILKRGSRPSGNAHHNANTTGGIVNEINKNGDATFSSSTLNLNNSINSSHSYSHATEIKLHTQASSSTFVGTGGGVFSSTTKFDNGPATPRAQGYLYPLPSNKNTRDTLEGDDDELYRENEGRGKEKFVEGGHARFSAALMAGGDDWYIDKYGRRSRRSDTSHHRTQSAGSVHKTIPSTSRIALSKAENGTTDLVQSGNPDLDGDSSGHGRVENTTDHAYINEVLEDEEEDDDDDDDEDENDRGVTDDTPAGKMNTECLKRKKKKKKAKKRKIPVTASLVPITATASLSHSHSAPNLRSEAGRTSDDLSDTSAAEDDVKSGDGLNGRLRGSREIGALVPSVSFPEVPKSSNSKKIKQSSIADSFVLRGDSSYVNSWLIGESSFATLQSKRARLVTLARYLQTLFPEEQETLRKVIRKLGPPLKADKKNKKKKSGKPFLDDCSLEYSSLADSDLQRARDEQDDPDPRGDLPGKKDTVVHVFIDHSNILIGFLTHLKRMSKKLKRQSSATKQHSTHSETLGTPRAYASVTYANNHNGGSRPLPMPKTKAGLPIPDTKPLIPLPSFATANLSRSTFAFTKNNTTSDGDRNDQSGTDEGDVPVFEFAHEGYGYEKIDDEERGKIEGSLASKKKTTTTTKRPLHLWHAALSLVLERGRPVSRRYVVASRPLHQPMESIGRLGYEVSVLTRVPDFGDGADRLEKATKYEQYNKDKDTEYQNGSPTKGITLPSRQIGGKSHARRISTTNANGETDLPASTGAPATGSGHQLHSTGSTRVKYREQGVDEVLQLKLLTTIATTDDVPEGATIILATGDGNVGQFNQDGYLGPVRNALKRGWKVELYAWEDGLSRSWRREFGPTSEWGKKGMFRVVAMEQFAEHLVDLG